MGKEWNQWLILFFGAPKLLQMVTAAMKLKDAYSLEGKLWHPRQHIKKQRHYVANKGPPSQGYGFSSGHVWMWELDYKESWAPKYWCFWTVVWRRLLRIPWTARRSNQSILKEISPGYALEDWCWSWNSNTLGTSCEELTRWKRSWCWERWKAGGEGDIRGWDGWMASPTQWTWLWVNIGSLWWTGRPGMLQFMASQSRTWLSDWTEFKELYRL